MTTAGALVDAASIAAGEVMQAHWFRYSDSALVSPFVARFRSKEGDPPLTPGDVAVDLHPYIDDLARLAGLLALAPWREPLDQRETVEEFRRRIARTVALYRDGLGTRAALRAATLAALPVADRAAPPGLRERGFTVEEAAPVAGRSALAAPRGAPAELVGPLMRWRIESGALAATAPEIYVEGVAAVADAIDATDQPIIERFDPATGTGLGIAYAGTVAPGQALAILPAFASWLGGEAGVATSRHEPGPEAGADPTAPGPWAADAGGPAGSVRGFAQGPDGTLWAAVNAGGVGALWRLDAAGWTEAVAALPEVHCLLADGADLLLGHANGLARLPAAGAAAVPLPDPAAGTGPAVRALARGGDGRIWAARATGAARLGAGDALEPVGPGARAETEARFDAVLVDRDGLVYFGGAPGLFLHDPRRGAWHVYSGETADELSPDWLPWDPATAALPDDAALFLPPVTSLLRGSDQTLWIGTAAGLAAYRARARLRTYGTLLEAFPELGTGPVTALAEDERQRLWAATARGLIVFDGLDWRQAQGGILVRLPRVEPDPLGFTHWSFDRGDGSWHAQERGGAGPPPVRMPAPVTTAEPAVTAIAWTDGAVARLGTLSAAGFAVDADAVPAALGMRYKPDAVRVLDGGMPAVPRLLPGGSDWRYLAREEATPPTPTGFPAWTREGRLLPPPGEAAAPLEGRFMTDAERALLEQVFTFNPAARVTFRWRPRAALSVLVRLERRGPDETIAPAVLDRLWDGIGRVRPAGVRVALAVGETIVRGGSDG